MTALSKAYLDKLYEGLKKMPESERLDAVREIESHISDAVSNGQPEAAVIARLGDPRKLAKAYYSEYITQGPPLSIRNAFGAIAFYCTTGLLSIMIVPVLATVAYGFGLCTVLLLLGSFARTLGFSWISMQIGDYVVPTQWSFVVGLAMGAIIGGIAFGSWKLLKLYLAFHANRYRSMLQARMN